jgi:hypothetical protein
MGQGREAVTVRQAILIVMLIGAAFLGGAFVNGPGLQWAQARVFRSLGLNNGGEIAAVNLESASNGEIAPEPADALKPRATRPAGPIAPMPSIESDDKVSKQDEFDQPSVHQTRPNSTKSGSGSDQFRKPSLPSATSPRSVTKSSSGHSASLDPQVKPAQGDSSSRPPRSAPPSDKLGARALLDPLAALLPLGGSSTDASQSSSPRFLTGSKAAGAVGDEWVLLESRMQTLGVSRFTIDGKPGGTVVFACLIPVAGRQAVTARFEAEGDDVIQAARATLRRIVLWNATHLPRNEQINPAEKVDIEQDP